MNRFTKMKFIIVSFLLLVLTACGYNNAANDNNQNENNDRSARSAGIHRINKGYITDEHEPYRTSMSSDTYPHTSSVQNETGQRKYFKFIQKRIVVNPGGQTGQGSITNPNPGNYQNVTPGGNLTGDNGNTGNNGNTGSTGTGTNVTPPPTQQPATPAPAPAPTEQPKAPTQTEGAAGISSIESQVIELTNQQRAKNGLPALKADTSLSKVARTKSNDMRQKNYFSHTSPTYGSPFDMMRDFGVTYKTAGENIAKGQQSAQAVVDAWMNSEGHRKNILSPNFTHIGVGHDANGNYWTQMFIGK